MSKHFFSSKLAVLLGSIFLAPNVFAGQSAIIVSFGPGQFSIPTLGSYGLILAALLLAVAGMRVLKSRAPSAKFVSVALLAGSLTLALNGESRPIPDNFIEGADCAGGSIRYVAFGREGDEFNPKLVNNCDVPQQVTSYEETDVPPSCFVLVENCPIGTLLRAGDSCELPYYDSSGCPG